MKLKIKKYVNNNQMNKGYGKTYGRIEHLETLQTRDLAKHIQKHGSIYTSDVIVGVLERFSMCIEELLQEGYKVKLNGLGTFYLSAKSSGELEAEDYDVSNIERVQIKFLADKSKDYDWNSKSQTTRSRFQLESASAGQGAASGGGSGSTTGQDDEGEDRP